MDQKLSGSPPSTSGERVQSDVNAGERGHSVQAESLESSARDAVAAPDPSTPPSPSTPSAPSTPPAEPTPEEIAASFIAQLDAMQAQISNYQHHDPSDIRRVAAIARFAPDLVVPTLATTMSFPPAAQRNLFDNDKGQMAIRRKNAFQPVIQRLGALKDGMQFTVNSDLAEAGSQALDVYTWAKSYVKRPDAAALIPYVGTMSQVVRKVINHRRQKSSPAPAPSPSPAPTPAQLPPGAQGFLASNVVPSKPAVEDVFPDHFNEALDRATKE